MVDIVTTTGATVTVPDNLINVVSGPYTTYPNTESYIRGDFGPGALESSEDAAHLVSRLQVTLARLTRPNGTPVWIKVSAITVVRYPIDTEIPDPPNMVRSVIMVGGFHQALQEDVETVKRLMSTHAPATLATSVALMGTLREFTGEFFSPDKIGKVFRKASKKKVPRKASKRKITRRE